MRPHFLAAALALVTPLASRGEGAAAEHGDVYIRWRLGTFLPGARTSSAFTFDAGPGVTLGASTGLPLGRYLAVEGGLGYSWAPLHQAVDPTGPALTSLDDLAISGSLVGRLELGRLEVGAVIGAGAHHPTIAALSRSGPDVALGGQAGLLVSYLVGTQARLGLEAEEVVLRPRFGPRTLRLDGLHLAATLTHRW